MTQASAALACRRRRHDNRRDPRDRRGDLHRGGFAVARIAVGGFQHETNTFAPGRASFAEFERHDAWPGLTRGAALFEAVAGINLPVIPAERGQRCA